VFGAVTYLGDVRLARWHSRRLGRLALAVAQRVVSGGSVRIGGGAAGHLRLSSADLPLHHQQGYGLVRGVIEPGVQEALRRVVRPGAVVYDVGANIGFFSLLSARLTGEGGRVEAFEPVPDSAAAIRANAALNAFGWIGVHEVAVGEHSGAAELLVNLEPSWSHLADRGENPAARSRLAVPVVVLDELVERGEIPPPDVVKIDVEGSEAAVLRGLERTLRGRPVAIVCELHETNAEVLALLEHLGYATENLDGPEPVATAGAVHVLSRPR
jgi:FkbM family methyltransferase